MKAIALTQVWNHETDKPVQPGETFEMSEDAINSLIEINAAKACTGIPEVEPAPVQVHTPAQNPVTVPEQSVTVPAQVIIPANEFPPVA